MINIGLSQTLEYRARYLNGFFAGIGLHLNLNALPEIVDYFEPFFISKIINNSYRG